MAMRTQGRSGFVQARWRGKLPVLDLLFIAPTLDARHGTTWLWQHMVHELVNVGGQQGAQRLFTELPENHHAEIEVMRQSGFSIYGQDRLYSLKHLASLSKPKEWLWQRKTSVDEWGLQRLYFALTPDVVQQAESLRLHDRTSYVGVYSITGEELLVIHSDASFMSRQIDLSELASGTYYIRTEVGTAVFVKEN